MRGQSIGVFSIALAFVVGSALAGEKLHDTKEVRGESAQTVHKATGVVKKMDPSTGQVTLEHGPVKSLNWPPMSMAFDVKDKALLRKLLVGKKVVFHFIQEGSKYVVTQVE